MKRLIQSLRDLWWALTHPHPDPDNYDYMRRGEEMW